MTRVDVIVASAEEADDGIAEFWLGPDMLGETIIDEGQLHLRIEPRRDGRPWMIETTSLARGLAEAARQLAAH
jgi:hypothetical protein